ncbi:MAG: FecR protein [Candidatus Omnitrophica bacterium ADurb.Bin314]|nr:MAG: FecR protein [Candidatus Omnitrophica bacterium ADurb.Bin314]
MLCRVTDLADQLLGFMADLRQPVDDVKGRLFGGVRGCAEMLAQQGAVFIDRVQLPGDEVKTAGRDSVVLALDGGKVGKIELKGGSLFRIRKMEQDPVSNSNTTLLDLAIGKLIAKVEPLRGVSKFEVRTPTALTGVRGTVFEVEVKPKKSV